MVKHTWRTRPDPFAEVWKEVEQQLKKQPHLEAKRLFLGLQERYPGRFKDGQLRTMQRRVKAWRLRQARFVAEEIGLILTAETGDGLAGSAQAEAMPVVAVNRLSLICNDGDAAVRLGELCTGEQVCDLSPVAQRYYEEVCQDLTLGYVATTGIPRWSG